MNFPDQFTDRNRSLEKLSFVICGMSVIILPMDLLTDKASKKKLPASFHHDLHR
jgi:hypothetical protein